MKYQTIKQLRRNCEKDYGLPFEEALEMAYENAIDEIEALRKFTKQLTREDIQAGRILRGHRNQGCRCGYCRVPAIALAVAP